MESEVGCGESFLGWVRWGEGLRRELPVSHGRYETALGQERPLRQAPRFDHPEQTKSTCQEPAW